MTYPEMFYKVVVLFFSSFWTYLGLIVLILSLRGHKLATLFSSVKTYFGTFSKNYKNNLSNLDYKELEEYRKRGRETAKK